MHVSNAWCFLHHGVRWKVFHSSVSSTNLDFVHLRSIWFPNQITRDLLWKWNGRKKCIDCGCWSYAICTSSFTYLVSVQLIWEGKSFTSRSKKLNFHLNDAHHPVFEQSIFAEKRYYCRRDARDSTIAGSTSLEDMIPFTRATFATENEVPFGCWIGLRCTFFWVYGWHNLPHPRQWWTCQHPIQAENWWFAEWVFAGWREQKSWKSSVGKSRGIRKNEKSQERLLGMGSFGEDVLEAIWFPFLLLSCISSKDLRLLPPKHPAVWNPRVARFL